MNMGAMAVRHPIETTDEDLLKRTCQGEEVAFQELYQRHLDTIFRFAYRMLGSPEQAEDVAHDCFLSLIRNPRCYDPRRGSLRTYLYTAVRNIVLKRLRKVETELVDSYAENLPANGDTEPLLRLLSKERSNQVRKSIGKMPPLQREAIVLFEYEELSLAEIAAIAGTDTGTIKSRLHRAREWLRRELASYMNGDPRIHREAANHE